MICEEEREMKFDLLSPFPVCTQLLLTGVALEQGSFTKAHSQNTILLKVHGLLQVGSVSQKMTRIRITLREIIVLVWVVHMCVLVWGREHAGKNI